MKTSVTAATNLSPETTPGFSGESELLIQFQSPDNSPVFQTTTAVIESEWTSRTHRERPTEDSPLSELALSPMSLSKEENVSLLSPPVHQR